MQKAIINEDLIKKINDFTPENLEAKCLAQAAGLWNAVQEATCKVLNAITQRNGEGISILLFDMFLQMLKILAFLNHTPYVTFSSFIAQAREFKIKPERFNDLIDLMVNGTYTDLSNLADVVTDVFSRFETRFEELDIDPYYNEVDPNIPQKVFR